MASPLRSLLLLLAVLAVAWAASPKQGMRLVGGVIDANANDTGVLEALNFAMSEYNKENNDAYHSRAIQVVKARKQIVAGVKYFLDVEIGRTTCTKTETALELTKCPFHEQPHLIKKAFCSFQILSVPWLGKQTLTRSSCKSA
ncbi:cystatin-C [Psammomys obesus]|uniref:cystatin-C n=1 Tax=Psammomys obesus TaxID=48139 RepID=UPI00245303D5|nr:cystatin-C [Psammomys obesus]